MKKLNRFKPWGLLVCICLLPYLTFAQSITVTGVVKDISGEELIGVNVTVKGSTTGTVTDIDGNYSIPAMPNSILAFSYIGYKTAEIAVNGKSQLNVILSANLEELEEVVVIAYGAQKKITITGAVSNVNTKEILKTPSASLGNALSGKLPGLSTVQFSGIPGADDPTIFVRGIGSLSTASSTPLILVDGVERSFSQIDPHEVADITILKDASATAVFGVRGANGVILVTTRRGEAGKTSISFTTSLGVQAPTTFLEYADSYTLANFYNNAQLSDGVDPRELKYSEEAIKAFKDGSQPLLYPSIDWMDYIMKNTALQSQHNVNISGGNEKARYFVSAGLLTQDGIFKTFNEDKNTNFKYNRYNYRANIDIDITRTSTLSLNLGGRLEDRNIAGNGEEEMFRYLLTSSPMAGAGIVDGKRIVSNPLYVGTYSRDALSQIYALGYTKRSTNVVNFDLIYDQKLDMLTKGLSFKIKGSYNSSYTQEIQRRGGKPYYMPVKLDDGTIGLEKSGDENPLGYNDNSSWFSRDWYVETSLNYQRSFGNHNVTGLLLYNQSKDYYHNQSYPEIPIGYVGSAARITYDYQTRYLLDLNMGYNGSENFAPGKRYGFFPSGSIGWVITSEKFMESQTIFNYIKLRYSYGLVGNDKMGGARFLYLPGQYMFGVQPDGKYGIEGGGYNFGTNITTYLPNAYESSMGNPDVTWEKAAKQNIGLDLRTFDSRLSVNVDVFREKRRDILIGSGATIPLYAALSSTPPVNFGKVNNKGYEIVLTWTDRIGEDFIYSISPNMAFSRNKIIEQLEVTPNEPYLSRTGKRVGQKFGYKFWGFYEGPETEEKYKKEFGVSEFPTQMAILKPGDCVYVDLNNDGKIDNDDQCAMGYSDYPEYTFALNVSLSYKGFDFSMLWNGATHVSRMLGTPYVHQLGEQFNDGLLQWVYDNSWTAETASTAILPRMTFVNTKNNTVDSEVWMTDASYIRLKNIELGYTIPKIPQLKAVSSARIYFTGYNLLTFSKFKANDPENKGGTWENFVKYPLMKVYNIGLQVNF